MRMASDEPLIDGCPDHWASEVILVAVIGRPDGEVRQRLAAVSSVNHARGYLQARGRGCKVQIKLCRVQIDVRIFSRRSVAGE